MATVSQEGIETGRRDLRTEKVSSRRFGSAPRLPAGVSLARVRVAEDATLHAECTGLP